MDHSDTLNNYLGVTVGNIVNPANVKAENRYVSAYGDGAFTDENLRLMVADTYRQNVNEMLEGAVLLKNEGQTLPLGNNERRIALLGKGAEDPANAGSGAYYIDLPTALRNEGFTLDEAAETAVIVLTRSAGEGVDLKMSNKAGISALALQEEEKELLSQVAQDERYAKRIVLLNTTNPMELEWLERGEYGIDAALWIGGPGLRGFEGVAKLLTGEANPSGRLTDTYAADSLSAPACVNANDNTQRWENAKELKGLTSEIVSSVAFYTIQAENIYIGYKYYETRYEDAVLGRFGADTAVGASRGDNWRYADEVVYPFGYGLSYTSFTQTLDAVRRTVATERARMLCRSMRRLRMAIMSGKTLWKNPPSS